MHGEIQAPLKRSIAADRSASAQVAHQNVAALLPQPFFQLKAEPRNFLIKNLTRVRISSRDDSRVLRQKQRGRHVGPAASAGIGSDREPREVGRLRQQQRVKLLLGQEVVDQALAALDLRGTIRIGEMELSGRQLPGTRYDGRHTPLRRWPANPQESATAKPAWSVL